MGLQTIQLDLVDFKMDKHNTLMVKSGKTNTLTEKNILC